jgi:hypothetical protein
LVTDGILSTAAFVEAGRWLAELAEREAPGALSAASRRAPVTRLWLVVTRGRDGSERNGRLAPQLPPGGCAQRRLPRGVRG